MYYSLFFSLQGIPAFNNLDDLINVLTYFIYTCSVEHSATNFPQYEQYAFPPNFAAVLHGQPEQGMVIKSFIQIQSNLIVQIKSETIISFS